MPRHQNVYDCLLNIMYLFCQNKLIFILIPILKILVCSQKHPVSRANYDYTKKVVKDRWVTM